MVQSQPSSNPPAHIMVKDLRPTAQNIVNTTVIILEKGPLIRSDGGVTTSICLAADASAAVHLQLWGNECEAFQPGDIVSVTKGIFAFSKTNLVLRAGKKGRLEKVGEFTMVFTDCPNMSRLQWTQDPSHPTQWIPIGLGQQLPHSVSGGLHDAARQRAPHPERS